METAYKKGHEYEKFIANVINSLSERIGEYYLDENIKLNIDKTEGEIDIFCSNDKSYLFVECKNKNKVIEKNEIKSFAYTVMQKYNTYSLRDVFPKKFYAFFVSSNGFTRGAYEFHSNEDPFWSLTGRHINFYYIEPTIYNNECALGYEISESTNTIIPILLHKTEFTKDNLFDLMDIQGSNNVTLEERISACLKLLANQNRIEDKQVITIYERLANAQFNLKRYRGALYSAQILQTLPNKNSFYGYEANILEGLSIVELGKRLNTQKYFQFAQNDFLQKIGFMQILGDNAAKKGNNDFANSMYREALKNSIIYEKPYMQFTMLRKLYILSDPQGKDKYFNELWKSYNNIILFGDYTIHKKMAEQYMRQMGLI